MQHGDSHGHLSMDLWRELAHVEQWWSVHLDGHSTLGCIAILGLSNIKLCISTYMYQSLCFSLTAQEAYHLSIQITIHFLRFTLLHTLVNRDVVRHQH